MPRYQAHFTTFVNQVKKHVDNKRSILIQFMKHIEELLDIKEKCKT